MFGLGLQTQGSGSPGPGPGGSCPACSGSIPGHVRSLDSWNVQVGGLQTPDLSLSQSGCWILDLRLLDFMNQNPLRGLSCHGPSRSLTLDPLQLLDFYSETI